MDAFDTLQDANTDPVDDTLDALVDRVNTLLGLHLVLRYDPQVPVRTSWNTMDYTVPWSIWNRDVPVLNRTSFVGAQAFLHALLWAGTNFIMTWGGD